MKKSIAYLVLPLFAFMLGSCALGPIGPIDSSTSQSTSSSASSSSSNSSKTSSTSSSTSTSSKTIYYTITWADYDGSILDTYEVEKGEVPSYSGQTPTRSATAQYTYTFSGWTPTIVAATRDATYTAKYSASVNKYTVTWVDYDDTVLATSEVAYGSIPTYPYSDPTREATAQYTYAFEGWSPEVSEVTRDCTYKATYSQTVNEYTVTWANYDGTVLSTLEVAYGTTPEYTGETPVKSADQTHNYVFAGWDNNWCFSCGLYWYSETQPTESGNYWHYDGGVATAW